MTGDSEKPGAFPSQAQEDLRGELQRRGIDRPVDSVLVARSADIGIWHTEEHRSCAPPSWAPPFGFFSGERFPVLYRGFDVTRLASVLASGLDYPGEPFFATPYIDKAWEYPLSRSVGAILVLDGRLAERSFIRVPADIDRGEGICDADFKTEYAFGNERILSRFDRDSGRGTCTFMDEQMYGRWIPGAARSALLGVVLGGSREAITGILAGGDVKPFVRIEERMNSAAER